MTATERCRSCRAPIVWARTTAGRLMPLDPTPTDAGNVEIINGHAVVHGQAPLAHRNLYMPHFATCPQGQQWSGRSPQPAGERP